MATLTEILQRQEYATLVAADDYEGLRDALNDQSVSVVKQRFVTELEILAALGPTNGEAFLSGIESQEQTAPVIARIVRWIRSERGVDVGNADVRSTLDQLASGQIVSSQSAATIKALAAKTTSVAERDLGKPVTEVDVMDALGVGRITKYFDSQGNEVQEGQPYSYKQEVRG